MPVCSQQDVGQSLVVQSLECLLRQRHKTTITINRSLNQNTFIQRRVSLANQRRVNITALTTGNIISIQRNENERDSRHTRRKAITETLSRLARIHAHHRRQTTQRPSRRLASKKMSTRVPIKIQQIKPI